MPKFTTKVHFQKASDFVVLQNLARLNAGPRGRTQPMETLLKQFVNDAVRTYSMAMLEKLKTQAAEDAKTKANMEAIDSASKENANASAPTESSGTTEEAPERSANSAALADSEEVATKDS